MMLLIESARILSGIVASEKISQGTRDCAELALVKAIQGIEKALEIEKQMVTKASAEVNGIIS